MYIYRTVSIAYDKSDNCISFAAHEMKKDIESAGYNVIFVDLKDALWAEAYNRIILATKDADIVDYLVDYYGRSALPSLESQSYSIRKKKFGDFMEWYVIGSDSRGTMYGGLDFGQSVKLYGFDSIKECKKAPYIKQRGIKFNIPLDARTPSYSDAGDSAQANIANVWDMNFWREFLDQMARNFFNVLSLWNLHPFPSMVKVKDYPNAALNDVKRTTIQLTPHLEGRYMSTKTSLENLETVKTMTIDEKIKFWQEVMKYAQDRGIDIYIFTWNIFVYGTENSGYGFTASVKDEKTQDYFRKSVESLINTYPLLKGIGITSGENMSRDPETDESWLYNTYGRGINDALAADKNREFCLIHRIQYANIGTALKAFSGLNPRCRIETSFKYSQAHMYSSVKPDYIHRNNDSYLKDIGDHKTWLTVRDDDYYMLRGGCDPEFTRNYIKNMPYEKLRGFYMGPDGYTWGREYISKDPCKSNQLVIEKRWYCLMLWGRLAYDPNISNEHFMRVLKFRFTEVNAWDLAEAWAKASQVIPLVNKFHNSDCQLDFQWYPEACIGNTGFHDINRFIKTKPQSGEGIISIPEYVDAVLKNEAISEVTPVDVAKKLLEIGNEVLNLTKKMSKVNDKELYQTIQDINAMAFLGKYYSSKILGATNKCLADRVLDNDEKKRYKKAAIDNLKKASEYWRIYAEKVSNLYYPQTLTRMVSYNENTSGLTGKIDVREIQKYVDNDIVLAGGILTE